MVRPVAGPSGDYTYAQLEQLWVAAGGSAKRAPIMAAIAIAESGGDPKAENPSGATGLWQILGNPFPGNAKDPLTNARMAVAKLKSQGLGAWTTYTSGAYLPFVENSTSKHPGILGGAGFVDEAKKFLGVPYVWGGESPKGFDCSGLVQYVADKLGIKNVPRTSEEQWTWVQHITRKQLQPGDLVFYAGSDGTVSSPGHVAIYAGNDQIIQAPQTGEDVQQIPMPSGAAGYGRIPGIGKADFQGTLPSGSSNSSSGGGSVGAWAGSVWDSLWGSQGSVEGAARDIASGAAGLTGVPAALAGLAAPFVKMGEAVDWFLVPNHWVRIGCAIGGSVFTIMGLVTMTRTGRGYSVQNPLAGASVEGVSLPSSLPAPGGQLAPAIGIAEVTVGAILLFFAFHNLPSTVTSFGSFIGHLQAELQSQGAAG